MRSNMLDVMNEDFVTMARMKGLSEWTIVIRHAARNALLPVVTAFALGFGASIGGNVVVETVFSWPGLGRLLVGAVAVERLSAGAGRVLPHHGRAGHHELHRRPALRRARSAGVAWQARLTPRTPARRRRASSRVAARCSRRCATPSRPPGILIYVGLRAGRDLRRPDRDPRPARDPVRRRRQAARRRAARRGPSARHHQSRPRHLLAARHRHARARSMSG